MTYINNFIHNDYVFIPLYIGMVGVLTGSFLSNFITPVKTISKGTMTSPITDGTITPRTFNSSRKQLSQIQNQPDESVQTSPIAKDLFTSVSDKNTQTVFESIDAQIQTHPILTVDTTHLTPGFKGWTTYSHSEKSQQTVFEFFEKGTQTMLNPDTIIQGNVGGVSNTSSILKQVDLSVFGNISCSSKSVQAIPEIKSEGVQTLISNLDQGIRINPDLLVRADLTEFGTHSVQTSPINSLICSSVEMVDKAIQVTPNDILLGNVVEVLTSNSNMLSILSG